MDKIDKVKNVTVIEINAILIEIILRFKYIRFDMALFFPVYDEDKVNK